MDTTRTGSAEVTTRFSYAEAVVLFELLQRWEDTADDQRKSLFVDPSEIRVLSDLTASFEPVIDEVLSESYAEVLAAARAAVRDNVG